jgi:hypothetical protein
VARGERAVFALPERAAEVVPAKAPPIITRRRRVARGPRAAIRRR